jgi:stalled ribosome alternative rescue factor ArfA
VLKGGPPMKNPYAVKMKPEELQQFLHFKKRGSKNTPKKGKGSYNRKIFKGLD